MSLATWLCFGGLNLVDLQIAPLSSLARQAGLSFLSLPCAQAAEAKGTLDAIKTHMDQRLALFTQEKYEEAAQEFDRGYAEHPYPAFLFNAGVCLQQLGKNSEAKKHFEDYLKADPGAPDSADVKERIAKLDKAEAASGETTEVVAEVGASNAAMRSLVIVETEPASAPITVYRNDSTAKNAFVIGGTNADWKKVSTAKAPYNFTLPVGEYFIAVSEFNGYNASGTALSVKAGHVHHFKANLSQGDFMAHLRIVANVRGARIYIDDPKAAKPEIGRTPYSELVTAGEHDLLIRAPGFKDYHEKISLETGEQKETFARLERVDFGILRLTLEIPSTEIIVDQNAPEPYIFETQPKGIDLVLSSGDHRLRISADGKKTLDVRIQVPRGQIQPAVIRMQDTYPRSTAWLLAGLSAASLGGGIILGLQANDQQATLDSQNASGTLSNDDPALQNAEWTAIGANAAFGLSAILAGFSTYSFLKDPYPESDITLAAPKEFDARGRDSIRNRDANQSAPKKASPAKTEQKAAQSPSIHWGLGSFGGSF